MKRVKCLLLFSGGLDSILAAKVLLEQKIKVLPIFFKSYFFDSGIAKKSAKILGLKLKVFDFSKEHLKVVKKPKFGWGSSMNPCLDCHILMLKKAKEIMKKEKFDFVATGEVLGERPFSQNRKALNLVEKESSLKGYLLRPLSAKLLEPTIPEKKDFVDRKKFLDIRGKSRKRQIELAKKFKIKSWPQPAGGCILTDLEFGKKLRELLKKYQNFNGNDVGILKLGRHFWENKIKIVVGRDKEENEKLEKLAKKGDILIEMENYPGPLTLVRSYEKKKRIGNLVLEKAKSYTKYYSKKAKGKLNVKFKVKKVENKF
jgi:tRNA U34 2-thiouridine synthase MnmA/TrmU